MNKKGLSSDCKLPPEIAIAIQLEGREHPCDRCNEDRQICRGYPKGYSSNRAEGKIDHIRISIEPCDYYTGQTTKRFRVEISINGKAYGLEEIYTEDETRAMFDRVWESAGRNIKNLLTKP